MELQLSNEERDTLLTMLNTSYKELRDEIAHTDSYELRQSLKHTKTILVGVLDKLEPGWAARHNVPLLTSHEEGTDVGG